MVTKPRVNEADISLATLRIAAAQPNGIATLQRLKKEIPYHLNLSRGDRTQSSTRPNEEIWEQLIRNIKSHSDTLGNILYEGYAIHLPRRGYQITDEGRRYLKTRDSG